MPSGSCIDHGNSCRGANEANRTKGVRLGKPYPPACMPYGQEAGSERNEDNEDQTRGVMSPAPGVLECADMSALSNATGSAARKERRHIVGVVLCVQSTPSAIAATDLSKVSTPAPTGRRGISKRL